ncbi:ParB N-terminal domain-containing protein [Burkholderia cenocepacia]|uniref:ParB/RepB/Spo0J family partition protein n=1 Tax=Burkholderia cenocepacia TaxID=95486 RepID=UPI0023B9D932|nr:ParB N-terminal domain-containing protein [Burkholderia cenocepacia]MDF0506795.1 ParB N-terminal domain-containing protein [Burkholderia cenocepacia]
MLHASSGKFASISALTRAASGATRAAEIEQATGALTKVIAISRVRTKPQVRDDFSDVEEFAARLRVIGHVHTPILVRAIEGTDELELVAGERRIRASTLNGWLEIQAKIFPAGTPDVLIRKYQVSENIDRKPLSVRETAIGLANDVELYGRDEAARIWAAPNGKERSASWISKHLRFQRYGAVTRALFDENLFDDVEAANKLADIEVISAESALELAAEMRSGKKIGRLTLDARLSMLKQAKDPAQGGGGKEAPASAPGMPLSAPDAPAAQHADGSEASTPDQVHPDPDTGGRDPAEDDASGARERSSPSVDSVPLPPRGKVQRASAAEPRQSSIWRVEEIYEIGTGSLDRIRKLQADLSAAGMGSEDIEWRLWVSFVDLAASALAGMDSETAGKIINRFNDEINSSGPLELLNRLHPCRRPGVLPDDFRYDTDREIHPLAPNDWAL